MTPRLAKTFGVPRALGTGLAVVYFFTNVAGVHAAESNFWSDRRRAASLQWGEPDAATPSRGGELYARLPTAPSQGPDLSSLWEQPVHRVSQDLAQPSTGQAAQPADARLLAVAQAVAPYGQVRRVKNAPVTDGPLVLHIQDVHGNLEAQRNMSGMVLALAKKQNPLVGLEGAAGAFDTNSFHAYPDQDIVKSVADFFLEKDLIGGPEHAGVVASKSITLWGVEDPALYLAHVDAVKASLAGRNAAETLTVGWAALMEELKQKHFSSELREYDHNQSLYEQDRRGLGEYVETLKKFQSAAKSAEALPNVEKLLVAARREKTMDFESVENERRSLVEGLATRLSVPELQDLVRRSLDLKSGAIGQRAYQSHLRSLCAKHKLDLSRYPRLIDYMTYVADSETIERDALLDELARLETSAQDALVQTSAQREVVALSRDLSRLKKIFANEMTPADWTAYESRRTEIARIGRRLETLAVGRTVAGPADWNAFIGPYEDFCRKALARNAALADRLLEKMKADRKTTAVLVAGGFHTDGLVDLLAARGATVAVLTPKIGPVDGTDNYLDVFANDPLPVEKIFAGEPIALKAVCGLAGGDLAGDQTARVHAAVAGQTLMGAWEDLRGLGHSARTILRELRERLLALGQEVAGLALIQPHVQAVGVEGLTFSYRASNGREETVEFRSTDEGVVVTGARKTGPLTWLRGVWAIVSRPRPAREQTPPRVKEVPPAEGSFFQVREIAPGKLAKEVKEVVGPRGDVQYELSEADRERLAQLTVEYADRIRESVSRASGGRVAVSRFERNGRVLFVDKAPGAPRTRETAEDRKTYLDAMRGADNALGLDGLNDPIFTPDGWRIHVDRGSQNLFYAEDGKTVTWIDPVTVWPPADRRVGSAPRVSPLVREWGVAWRESFGFLRPLNFFRAHATWTPAERWVGALLIVGLWGVFGETAVGVFQWTTAIFSLEGGALGAVFAAGVVVGWAVTVPLHAGWNLLAERVNAALARREVVFRLPRLTIQDEMSNEFEAIEANLQTLRNGLIYLEKQKGNPSVRLQVVELYLQTIDRLTRLMADMEKYLPKQNVQKFRSRIFASQDWLPSPGKIINLIELIGRDGNYQTAHGFLGQIGKYTEFVSPLDTARLKDTQTALRQAALQAETQRMKGVRPNGKQVRAIAATLALTKAQEHWLDVYAALEREGLEVSFERMSAVGKRSASEYKRLWEEGLGGILADNWTGGTRSQPGDETLLDDLEAALEIHTEEEPTTDGFLKKWPTAQDFAAQIAKTANVPAPLVGLWLNLEKKGEYARLVKKLTSASPMLITDREGVEWRVMSAPKVFEKMKPTMADTVSRLARKLIELGDAGQTRGAEYSQRGILREKWATSWWIFGKKFDAQKTLMIYWFGSGSEAHAPGDSFAANKEVERKVFENADTYDLNNGVVVMWDLTESRPKPIPAGALPRVVEWLKSRGHDTAAAVRNAPWIESGLFSLAFLVPFALAMAGVDGSAWAVGGVYTLMNAYFGLQHTRAYRSVSGRWVEGPSTGRTKAWLAVVGMVVHLPLLVLALNPLMGPIGMLALYAGGALASVVLHRGYNVIAAKTGWPAATLVNDPAVERKTRIQNMMRTLIQFGKRVGHNNSPETPEEAAAIENATAVQIYRGLSNLGQRNPQGSQWRIALSLEERRSLLAFLLAELELLNRLLVKANNDLAAIDSQRSFAADPLVKTLESNRLRTEINRIQQEILPALQIVGMLGEGADSEFRDDLIYKLVGIVSHPMVDVNLRESFSRFLAERMIRDDDSVAGEILFDSLVPAEMSLPRGREFWKTVFTDAWPKGELPSRLFTLLQADNRTDRRLGLALLSFHGNAEERLVNLIQSSEVPTAFRLAALNRLSQLSKVSEATIQNISPLIKSADFIRTTESYLKTQADDSQWTADLFESPLFAAEDGKAFLTGVAVLLGGKLDMVDWPHFQSVGRNIDQARFLSFWDNAHAQMSFGGSMFRSYYGGVKYSGRLLTMVAAHEMVHAFLQSENFGYETVTQKRFHEYMSDMGTESIRDALRFSLGDMMSYAQTTGFFESGDGGVNNQHERARRQLLFYNEALNETTSVSRFHPDRMLEAGVQLMRAGGADAGDPNLTFANLFRGNLGLEPLSPGELKEADAQEGLLSVQTIARWLESAVDRPPASNAVAPRTIQPRGLLNRLVGFLLRTPEATPPPTRLRSERVGNQWVVSDSQGWRVALPILPVQTVDGSLFPAELPPGYLDVKWDGSIVTSYQGVAEDVPFERMVEMLEKLYRTTSAIKLFPRILGVQILPGSSVPRLIVEQFPEGNSFEYLGIQTPDADLDQRLSASFSPRLMERFRRGNFNLDQGIYLRHFYLINGEVRYRIPLENYALSRFFDYLNPRTNAPPAGAMPGVVRWLQGRGLDIAGAIRRAPLIESGLFSLAFLVPFALTAMGAEGATGAAGALYALMNAYFGLQHRSVYRFENGGWVEGPSTWRTKVWLAGVGAVIHLPLLLAAVSPAVGVWGYVLGAGLGVGLHRLYNTIAGRVGWAAATVAPPAPLFWKAVRSAQTSVFPTQPSDDELMRQRFLRDKAETALWDLIGTVSPERMVGILQKTTGFRNLQLTGNIEVEYFSEGVHKYVFKVTVERVTPQGAKENLSFLLAMKKAKAADSITREEMRDLEQLRGLGAPLFGGTFTAKRSGEMFFLEEFIEGFTGQQLKDQGLLSNEHRRKLAATLTRIGDRLGGKAPSDSTLKNFIIRQDAGHAIMVDIGSGRTNIGPDASGFDLRIFLLGVLKHMTDEKSEDQVRAVIEGLLEGLSPAKARVFLTTLASELRRSPPVNNPGMDHARNILMEKAAEVATPPVGAIPGVVDWLRARGLSTAAAVRHAPWIESGAFSVAFFAVLTLAMAGVDGGSWAASGVYGLMNAYFGYKHDTVFRFQNGNWVETRATWKTRLGLAGVGFAIHAPLLLSAWSAPFVGGLWFAVLYPFLAAASVQAHRWYNEQAKERGWAAATVGRGEVPPGVGEGSFFTVTDVGNGILRKEVKEYVGPPHRLYRLSESEREKAAALVVDYTNRIRRVVNEQLRVRDPEGLRNTNFVPLLRREGRFIYVDKVDGLPFNEAVGSMTEEMAEEARRDIRGAVRAASDVFDLKYDQMLPLEDGWRIGVDNKTDNFLFAASGDLNGWIDAISPWPPESHRVEPPSPPSRGTPGAVEVNYDGRVPRVAGWTSPLERTALTDLQKQVAALLRALPSIREETRNGYKREVLEDRGAKWPTSFRGRENEAYVFEIPSNGKNYWVKVAFGLGVAQLANEAAGAAPATGVPGVREMVDFRINESPLQFSYVAVEAPRGQPVGQVMLPATTDPLETRAAVAARIESIPVEHVRAAHETVRLLAERGVTATPALTRYDAQFGFVFEGLWNEADPLRQMAAEWFPDTVSPGRAADEVVARVLSAVTGLYPGQSNPYYFAARERVASAVAGQRATDRRISETLVESLRRAWREQIDALRPGNLFPAGFSARQVGQSALVMVGLLTATVDALAASVGAVLGGKAVALAHSLSFAGVAAAFAGGWRILTTMAGGVPTVDTLRTDEVSVNPFGWRIDTESEAIAERLGLKEDLSRLLLGGSSRPVWLGFKDLRRTYRPGVSLPTADSQAAFRAHLADMARWAGREEGGLVAGLWGVNANDVFRAAALRRGQSWGGITLSRLALAELVLATSTPFQRALPWFHGSVRWALRTESSYLERGHSRSQADRLVRAARAVAVLRAAGFSLTAPTTALNQEVSQEQDRRLILNAAGVGRVDVALVEDAYNATLEKIGATNLWLNAGTAAFVRLAGGRAFHREGIPAGGPTGTLYFNIDALVRPDAATEEQRGKVAESLEGVLAALSGEYLRDRLVLTTSASGVDADPAALSARLTREFGPSFRALQDLMVLNETNASALYQNGSLRLSVLADHAKGRGTGDFELWTHDAKNVLRDRPGLDKILVVDILDVAAKFDRMLRQMRFLATNA